MSVAFIWWVSAGVGFFWFLGGSFFPWLAEQSRRWQQSEVRTLDRVVERLAELRERIQAGVPPSEQDWDELARLPEPWGTLTLRLVKFLREQGAAILPTLQRLEASARQERRARGDAQVQTGQARSQITLALVLAPLASVTLATLLPGVAAQLEAWCVVSFGAFALNAFGLQVVRKQIESAVRGGLPEAAHRWPVEARCTGEAILAFLRGGAPPDQAWVLALEPLQELDPRLAAAWGHSLWLEPAPQKWVAAELRIQAWATGIRRILHVALMEGYASGERLEAALGGFSEEWNFRVMDGVARSATHALRPLFICVMPSLLGLLVLAVALEVSHGG